MRRILDVVLLVVENIGNIMKKNLEIKKIKR